MRHARSATLAQLGRALDIAWPFAAGELWLLRCRPVTT